MIRAILQLWLISDVCSIRVLYYLVNCIANCYIRDDCNIRVYQSVSYTRVQPPTLE